MAVTLNLHSMQTLNPNSNPSNPISCFLHQSLNSPLNYSTNTKSRSRNPRNTSISTQFSLNPTVISSSLSSSSPQCLEFDIVIIGVGIIGLTILRKILKELDYSMAIIDASVPCASGATGAGQGYIWMAGKKPGSEIWGLGVRGKKLWEELAESIQGQGMSPLQELRWKKTGSLLIGRTKDECDMLQDRVKLFEEYGVRAEFLSRRELGVKGPLVDVGEDGCAAFLPDDCQIDASYAVEFIWKENKGFGLRYVEFFNDPFIDVVRSSGSGEVEGVQTRKNVLYCKKSVEVSAGSWSGSLVMNIIEKFGVVLDVPVKTRKGHLLVIENFDSVKLNHGLMEVGYMDHQIAEPTMESGVVDYSHTMSISITATLDVGGILC